MPRAVPVAGPALDGLLALWHRTEQAQATEKSPFGRGPRKGQGGCVQLGISPRPGLRLRCWDPRAVLAGNNTEMVQLWL